VETGVAAFGLPEELGMVALLHDLALVDDEDALRVKALTIGGTAA